MKASKKILGIDAINIRNGGGVTHLVELLKNAENYLDSFENVIVWSKQSTLDSIADKSWIKKINHQSFERNLIVRVFWQRFFLKKELKKNKVDIVFLPGSGFINKSLDFVTMCRNVLPFDEKELQKYKYSTNFIKFKLLKHIQISTFNNSTGLIYLNDFAKNFVGEHLKKNINSKIIPHGCNQSFYIKRKEMKFNEKVYIYVSRLEPYKNHLNLLKAINKIKLSNFKLVLVGPLGHKAYKIMKLIDSNSYLSQNVEYVGEVNQKELVKLYDKSNIGVFLSSCENLPNILIEKMAAGLPVLCSNNRPMTDILPKNNFFVNETNVDEISKKLQEIHTSNKLDEIGKINSIQAEHYSWNECAKKTFSFLNQSLKALQ